NEATNLYRIGTHISARRFHATVEQGRSDFRSDSSTNVTGTNLGNNLNPVLGQSLTLSSLFRATGVRGNGPYTRLTGTASPFSWLDVYAQYTQASPRNDVHMQQTATGSFVLLSQALFYSSLQGLSAASARLPHKTANIGWELRPLRRLRATQSWNRDRLTSSSTASNIDQLLSLPLSLTNSTTSFLGVKENRLETNLFFEGPRSITLRGGHRAVWGDAFGVILPAAGLPGSGPTSLHRQIGLGGITWRPGSRWSVSADAEVGTATSVWFRTSLYDYNKVRATGRAQLTSTLRLAVDYRILHNDNPYSGPSYKFDTHQESASLNWAPKNGKLDFDGSYEHCGYHSEIRYLVPQNLQPATSVYREYCHTISGTISGGVRSIVQGQQIKFIAGGAAVLTAGSRPTTYYQPIGRVTVPVTKQVAFFAEWRYYGLGETFYMYEAFRAHLLTTGLRFTR
ncbi:MAG TPA: hypothetical protein VNH18_07915, partial [Bryobacteraceae bacterium]|nr:hypothetical protein [Bryobacteraceae bacterium]